MAHTIRQSIATACPAAVVRQARRFFPIHVPTPSKVKSSPSTAAELLTFAKMSTAICDIAEDVSAGILDYSAGESEARHLILALASREFDANALRATLSHKIRPATLDYICESPEDVYTCAEEIRYYFS